VGSSRGIGEGEVEGERRGRRPSSHGGGAGSADGRDLREGEEERERNLADTMIEDFFQCIPPTLERLGI
jgi:hypothetical protein